MKDVVDFFLDKGMLVNSSFIEKFKEEDFNNFFMLLDNKIKKKPIFLNDDLFFVFKNVDKDFDINWNEFNKSLVLYFGI